MRDGQTQDLTPPPTSLAGYGVGTWAWDIRSRTVSWSPEVRRIYGLPAEREMAPGLAAFLDFVHPADRGPVMSVVSETLARRRDGHEHQFRIVRPDGHVRRIISRARLELDGNGAPSLLHGLDIDLGFPDRETAAETPEQRREGDLAEREARYHMLFTSIDEGYCLCDMIVSPEGLPVDYRFLEVNPRFEEMTGLTDATGRTAKELVPGLERQWVDTYARVGLGGETIRFHEGSAAMGRVFDVFAAPGGKRGRFLLVFRDITEQTQQTEHIRLLMREVTHRAKNILAVVLAVARSTAGSDVEEFRNRFSERISALAASHDLLVAGDWRGVDIAVLIRSQLAHFSDLIGGRIATAGPATMLAPDAAEAIGMAMHELATNAGKYGALSDRNGRVTIAWTVDETVFRIRWTEEDGPPVSAPSSSGFGTTVVQRLAEMSLGAAVNLDFAPGGLVWQLSCPVSRLAHPGGDAGNVGG